MALSERVEVHDLEERPEARGWVHLLDVLPQLGEALDAEQLVAARGALRIAVADLPAGPWPRETIDGGQEHGFGAVVVSGLLTRHLDIGGHPALDLHGPGDVIGSRSLSRGLLPAAESWAATTPTRIGLLDDRFLMAARRWPRLVSGLFHEVQEQRDRVLLQLVIAEQPRVEDRILTLFWHLSERFGNVTPEGIAISLTLTHEALGRLIGARRPTVTLALRALCARGVLERRPDRSWLVAVRPEELAATATPLGRSAQPVPVAM
jgi:CRP-like cAMP-binding protein